MKKSYEDILYCKRPVSKNHPPMSRESRAAQWDGCPADFPPGKPQEKFPQINMIPPLRVFFLYIKI